MDYVYMVFFVSIVGVCATPIFSSDKMQIGIPMEESFPEFSETDESDELDQPDQPYKLDCGEMPEYVLEEILGPAYNARYMSLKPPPKEESQKGGKRNIVYEAVDFFVDHDLDQEVGNQAAWDVTNHVKVARENNFRFKRELVFSQEWHCKQRIKWLDLGPDYFPRYLRTVECMSESCWFDIYKCKPKSFSVKLLKRKKGRCTTDPVGSRRGMSGLPRELREMWMWEERAVTFCCDCGIGN